MSGVGLFEKSETIGNVVKALTQVQAKIRGASKDATNPHFRASYATLESVMEAVREPLASAKLAVIQPVLSDGASISVSTVILHESGEYLACRVPCLYEKQTMQAVGSAISYARRYGIMAMLAIPAVDDDGEAAVGREGAPMNAPSKPQSRPAPPKTGKIDWKDKAASDAQKAMITKFALQLGWNDDDLNVYLTDRFKHELVSLTGGEASAAINELGHEVKQKQMPS